jgi:hypothetical protein
MKKSTYIAAIIVMTLLASCTQNKSQPHNVLGINEKSAIHTLGDLPENPLLLHGMTTSIQPKDSSISTLYGNEIAYVYAHRQGGGNYSAGAVLYYVTWKSAADELWFGAHVPSAILIVEQLTFTDSNKPHYTLFKGNKRQIAPSDFENRIKLIKSLKIAAFAE